MAKRPCPICRAPAAPKFRPFCSLRCQQVDLGRWFSERYRVPTDDQPDTELNPWAGGLIDSDEALKN